MPDPGVCTSSQRWWVTSVKEGSCHKGPPGITERAPLGLEVGTSLSLTSPVLLTVIQGKCGILESVTHNKDTEKGKTIDSTSSQYEMPWKPMSLSRI